MSEKKSIAVAVGFLLLAACLSIAQGKKPGGSAEQQIGGLTDQLNHALVKGDTSLYEKYCDDGAIFVHGNGEVTTKAQEIANLKSGSLKYDSYDVRKKDIHSYGNTVVAILEVTAKGRHEGKPFAGDFRTSRVWTNENGNWKFVLYQVATISASK